MTTLEHIKPIAPHLLLGRIGEELAANYLVKNGFYILERNWRSKYGYEIDIIAFKDNILHFVEVKTRRSSFVDPLSAIDSKKASHLCRGAYLYKKYKRFNYETFIDSIRIIYRSENDYDLTFVPGIHTEFMFHKPYYKKY